MRASSSVARLAVGGLLFVVAFGMGQRQCLAEPPPAMVNCTFPPSVGSGSAMQILPANGMRPILDLKGGPFPANLYAADKSNESFKPMISPYADIVIRDVKVYRQSGNSCTARSYDPGSMVVRLRISAKTTVPVQRIRVLCGLYGKDPNVKENVKLSSLAFPFTFPPILDGEEGLSEVFLGARRSTRAEGTIVLKGPAPSFVDADAVLRAVGMDVTFKVAAPPDANPQWDKKSHRYHFTDTKKPWLVSVTAVTGGVDSNLPDGFPLQFQKTSGVSPTDFKLKIPGTENSAEAFGTLTPGGQASTNQFVDDMHLGHCEARVNE